jgi:hypothetical protein
VTIVHSCRTHAFGPPMGKIDELLRWAMPPKLARRSIRRESHVLIQLTARSSFLEILMSFS